MDTNSIILILYLLPLVICTFYTARNVQSLLKEGYRLSATGIYKAFLARAGIEVLGETKHSLILKVNCAKVEYFPFTGGYRGKGIPSGRGLKNLIALKEGHSKEKAS